MQIERMDLLKRLLSVSPGLTSKDTIQQSSCVIVKKGRFYTMNREVACSLASNLDESLLFAVQAKKLLELIKKLTEETLDLSVSDSTLRLRGKNREARLAIEAQIVLPVSLVELPKDWQPLNRDFAAAADLAICCTKKKHPDVSKTCVHLHPEWIEGSDNMKLARWKMRTQVKGAILIRGTTLKAIVPLGMTKICETENWLHFRNPYGLRVSLRKWSVTSYPDFSQFLEMRGEKITFPKAIAEAADRAGIMTDDSDGAVKVSISHDRATVEGQGIMGSYTEKKGISYVGRPMSFLIPPKLIGELVEKQATCEVSESCLTVRTGRYVYTTSLEKQNEHRPL